MSILKREPAVLLGLLGSILVAVGQWASNGDWATWPTLIPVVVGIVTRSAVFSPATVAGMKPPAPPQP